MGNAKKIKSFHDFIKRLPARALQCQAGDIVALEVKTKNASILWLQGTNTGILLPKGLSCFAFRRLSEKQKNIIFAFSAALR